MAVGGNITPVLNAIKTVQGYSTDPKFQLRVRAVLRWIYLAEIERVSASTNAQAHGVMRKKFTDIDEKVL